jgi:hypothetical protein
MSDTHACDQNWKIKWTFYDLIVNIILHFQPKLPMWICLSKSSTFKKLRVIVLVYYTSPHLDSGFCPCIKFHDNTLDIQINLQSRERN